MKTILFALLFLSSNCFSQSILDKLGIKEIKAIEISYSPIMDENPKEGKIVKSITDSISIEKIKMILGKLPADGTCYKKFGKNIFTHRIKIIDQKNKTHRLIFFGTKLRSQSLGSSGTFYCGSKVNFGYEKELYSIIRDLIEKG